MIRLKKITVRFETLDEFSERVGSELRAIERREQSSFIGDEISFETFEQLAIALSPKRIELMRIINQSEPESIYALAKLAKRATENVNADIRLLKQLGFVAVTHSRSKGGRKKAKPEVKYDRLRIDMELK